MSNMKRLLVALALPVVLMAASVAGLLIAFGDTKAGPAAPTALVVAPTVRPTLRPEFVAPSSTPGPSPTPFPAQPTPTARPTATPRPSPSPVPPTQTPTVLRQISGLFVEPRPLPPATVATVIEAPGPAWDRYEDGDVVVFDTIAGKTYNFGQGTSGGFNGSRFLYVTPLIGLKHDLWLVDL